MLMIVVNLGLLLDVMLNDVPLITSTCLLDSATSLVLLIFSPDSKTSVTFHSMKLPFVVHMKTNGPGSSPGYTDASPDGDRTTSSVGFKCMHNYGSALSSNLL